MKRQHLLYAIALAILIVGLAFAGVPARTILLGLLVLACPLMMVMMGGHGDRRLNRSTGRIGEHDQHRPTSGHR